MHRIFAALKLRHSVCQWKVTTQLCSNSLQNFASSAINVSDNKTPIHKKYHHLIAELNDRRVLRLIGEDSYSVLQGIVSSNVNVFKNDSKIASQYTCFLNAQGRILCDAFIIRPYVGEFCSSCVCVCVCTFFCLSPYSEEQFKNSERRSTLPSARRIVARCAQGQLKFYTEIYQTFLFTKENRFSECYGRNTNHFLTPPWIKIHSHLKTSGQVPDNSTLGHARNLNIVEPDKVVIPSLEDRKYTNIIVDDPRSRAMYIRIYTSKNDPPQLTNQYENESVMVGSDYYDAFRTMQGILEGKELSNRLPFSLNMDILNAISFTKGCYIGQELTARTYHTGIVRTRAMPFMLSETDNFDGLFIGKIYDFRFAYYEPQFTEVLKDKQMQTPQGHNIGKVLYQNKNFGIIMCDYRDRTENSMRIQYGKYKGQVICHGWFLESIDAYLEENERKRQSNQKIFFDEN